MKTYLLLLASAILLFSCSSDSNTNETEEPETTETTNTDDTENTPAETVEIPADDPVIEGGYELMAEVDGDLDKDGIPERVLVLETPYQTDWGTEREIHVYKIRAGEWELWRSSSDAIMKSEEGGMMGDPFESIEIKNGILIVRHFGGSSWKWSNIDKYRWQNNEFELIGYTTNYGKPCEYWEEFDFNLSTGKINYELEPEECEDYLNEYEAAKGTFYEEGVKFNLQNRRVKEVEINDPDLGVTLYM